MKVLVVDDDSRLREALEVGLQLQWEDAEVLSAADGEAGLEVFFRDEPDVVLLDLAMPRMNGFEVLKEMRRVSDVPVIMLTARVDDVDQVRGLELGADDYVPKPFSHLPLMARMNEEVTIAGQAVKLTPVEYKLLYHLVRNAGHLMPHQALLDRVWGSEYDAGPEYLKVFISRLRAKLRKPHGLEYIETERGRGYRFVRPRDVAGQDRLAS